jgi:hypothetical protein
MCVFGDPSCPASDPPSQPHPRRPPSICGSNLLVHRLLKFCSHPFVRLDLNIDNEIPLLHHICVHQDAKTAIYEHDRDMVPIYLGSVFETNEEGDVAWSCWIKTFVGREKRTDELIKILFALACTLWGEAVGECEFEGCGV